LPSTIVQKLVDKFLTLPKLISASAADYTKIDGVAEVRSVMIKENLNKLKDKYLMERLLL
jgi:diadenylate cyclase